MKSVKILFLICVFYCSSALPQANFSLQEYKNFLKAHSNMNSPQLLEMHNAGTFKSGVKNSVDDALYLDSIAIKYELTDYEKELIRQNGFMVSERLSQGSMGEMFIDVYKKDIPVYISSDAILHAFHMSYDVILRTAELEILIPDLKTLLNQLHSNLGTLISEYTSIPEMSTMLKDVDVYLSVAEKLLTGNTAPLYSENLGKIDYLYNKAIDAESISADTLFADACVLIDWSQFKTRGHYDDKYYPQLSQYFKTMMWLGRIEFYLIPPAAYAEYDCLVQDREDNRRQVIDALLLTKLFDISGSWNIYTKTEDMLKFFVGEQDNVVPENIVYLKNAVSISDPKELFNDDKLEEFTDSLKNQSFAHQKILSQLLFNEGVSVEDSIVPASAFMLFGQRFVIDSYITGSVVFDRIRYNNQIVCRLFPSTLDPMFALGNDAAAQLLTNELNEYHYASNLAALRYLVDSYDQEFWNSTLYNAWLNMIRKLNPPATRDNLPEYMQTAAYWQSKLNTQLASWTQLRHDNLLYAKQSYAGLAGCSYPFAYLEPIPELYKAVKETADKGYEKFNGLSLPMYSYAAEITQYFSSVSKIMDTLIIISEKIIKNEELSAGEVSFLKSVIYDNNDHMCGAPPYYGWYPDLFYIDYMYGYDGLLKKNHVVADIHTTPSDCFGNVTGWVMHAGTGDINLGIYVASLPSGERVAFAGPALSYYEYTTQNFERLTDEEWENTNLQNASRPEWVNNYLANNEGLSRGKGTSLLTSVDNNSDKQIIKQYLTAANYPNPFNPSTIISFTIPSELTNSNVKLKIYNIQGEEITTLVNDYMPAGNYLVKWNGTNNNGQGVPSGVYIYNISAGDKHVAGKMTLIK